MPLQLHLQYHICVSGVPHYPPQWHQNLYSTMFLREYHQVGVLLFAGLCYSHITDKSFSSLLIEFSTILTSVPISSHLRTLSLYTEYSVLNFKTICKVYQEFLHVVPAIFILCNKEFVYSLIPRPLPSCQCCVFPSGYWWYCSLKKLVDKPNYIHLS